mgnify:CR=1 FL=1
MKGLSKHKYYFSIIATSFVLVTIVLLIKGRLTNDGIEPIGFFIGASLTMSLIPLLTMRFSSVSSGWKVFIVIGFLYILGNLDSLKNEKISSEYSTIIHHAKNCEFTVAFPDKPEIKIYTHPKIGDYEEALWVSSVAKDSTILRTECIPVELNIDNSNAKEFLLEQLAIFTKNNGLSSVEYRYSFEPQGPTGYARGIKYIEEKPVTYLVAMVTGNNSLVTLYAGGLSATFPQSEIYPFMDSVKKIK